MFIAPSMACQSIDPSCEVLISLSIGEGEGQDASSTHVMIHQELSEYILLV